MRLGGETSGQGLGEFAEEHAGRRTGPRLSGEAVMGKWDVPFQETRFLSWVEDG